MARNNRHPQTNNHRNSTKLLQRPENGLEAFMDASVDAFLLFDENLDLVNINPAGERMFGVSTGMVVGKNIVNLEPDIKKTRKYDKYLDVMKTGEPSFIEDIFSRPKFGDMQLSIKAFKMRKGLGMIVNDITERKRIEEALKRSEKYFRALTENSLDAVTIMSEDGTIRYESPSYERLLGFKPEERVGSDLLERIHPDDITRVTGLFAEFLQNRGSTLHTEVRAQHKDGSWRFIEAIGSNMLDNPVVKGIVVNLRDVTERKRMEEALRKSEAQLRTIFGEAAIGIMLLDMNAKPLEVNHALLEMIGYSREEFRSISYPDYVHPDDLANDFEPFGEMVAGKRNGYRVEKRFIRKDGGLVWTNQTLSLIRNAEGKPQYLVILVEDITERRRAEEEIRRLSDAVRMSTDSIVVTDMRGQILDGNEASVRMYGADSRADLMGMKAFDIIAPEDREKALGKMKEVMAKGYVSGLEYHVLTRDGRTMLVEASTAIMRGRKGEPVGFVGVSRDITERKRMEENLRESEERFRAIFDNSVDGILVTDLETKSLYTCNKAMCQMLGYNLEEIRNLKVTDIHPKKELSYVMTEIERERRGESPGVKVLPLERKDGSVLYAEVTPSLVSFAGRQYLAGIFRDISERKRAEEGLRESERKFRAIFDNGNEGFISVEPESGRFFNLNKKMIEMLGYGSEEEVANLTVSDIHPERDLPYILKEFSRHVKREISRSENIPVKRKDGSIFYASISTSPIAIADKMYLSCIFTDTTERKRMEEDLRASEARYRLLAENVQDVIWTADMNLKFTYFSPSVIGFRGYTAEEAMALSVEETLTPASLEVATRVIVEQMALENTGQRNLSKAVTLELEHRCKDGSTIWGEVRATFLRDSDGKAVGILGISRDIMERKRAEEALKISEERYRLVVENTNEYIVVAQDGLVKFFNSKLVGLLGYSREDLISKPFIDFIHPEDRQMVMERYRERLGGGTPPPLYSFRVVDKTGNARWVEISAVVFMWEGRPATLNFLTDVTERKKAEEEKQRMEEQLRLAGRLAAVGELAAGVAHELNNPLAAIQGFAQLLTAKDDLDETTKKDLGIVYRESQRAAKITQNLLSFARRHEPEKQLVLLNEVIEKTLELGAHRMKVNNIDVVVDFAADLPKTMVDFFQMQQVFVNIINNAEQAMMEAHGRGRLVVKTQRVGDMIRVSFADNGRGIPEEYIRRIFDPFFTTKEVGKGTGLGLSICYGIVEAHGGRIYARSKLGEGATFVVEIPIAAEGH